MSWFDAVLSVLSVVSLPTLVGMLVHARAKNRKLTSEADKLNKEANHLETEDVQVISATAVQLLNPLRTRVRELEDECSQLRLQVRDLSTEVEHQRSVAADTTARLELATRRADYYQRAFETRAAGP